ncbi:MAG: hypothetical protein QM784_18260 [Polyangiaceae bacterium]
MGTGRGVFVVDASRVGASRDVSHSGKATTRSLFVLVASRIGASARPVRSTPAGQ